MAAIFYEPLFQENLSNVCMAYYENININMSINDFEGVND